MSAVKSSCISFFLSQTLNSVMTTVKLQYVNSYSLAIFFQLHIEKFYFVAMFSPTLNVCLIPGYHGCLNLVKMTGAAVQDEYFLSTFPLKHYFSLIKILHKNTLPLTQYFQSNSLMEKLTFPSTKALRSIQAHIEKEATEIKNVIFRKEIYVE